MGRRFEFSLGNSVVLLPLNVTFDGPTHDRRDCGTDCGTPECRTHAHHCASERTDAHIRLSGSDLRRTRANGKRFKSPLLWRDLRCSAACPVGATPRKQNVARYSPRDTGHAVAIADLYGADNL